MMQLEERKIHYYIKLFLDLKKKSLYVVVNLEWKGKCHPELTTNHTLTVGPSTLFSTDAEV